MRRRLRRTALIAACVFSLGSISARARAATETVAVPPVPTPAPTVARRTAALGAAVVPGLVLHGAGHVAMGDRSTGLRLLAWEGIGLASLAGGLVGLAVTGASSRTVGLFIPMMIGGAGLFGTTWLSDVYGVAATPHVPGSARRPSWIEAEVGTRYVDDHKFSYGAFLVAGIDWRPGAFRVAPSAWLAIDGSNQRLRLEGAWRMAGDAASYVDLETAATYHRYGEYQFAMTLGEVSVGGRLDLGRAASTLAGSFAEGAVGFAAGGITYFDRTTDPTDLLLGRLGWGVYWGGASSRRGEAALFYDHRHDGYAGGMKLSGLGSGTLGSFGVRASGTVWRWLGVNADFRVGSAYVFGASLLIRPEGTP